MTLYFGDGIGDDPPVVNRDKTFTDEGYMVVGGKIIDLDEIIKDNAKEKAKEKNGGYSIYDEWMNLD